MRTALFIVLVAATPSLLAAAGTVYQGDTFSAEARIGPGAYGSGKVHEYLLDVKAGDSFLVNVTWAAATGDLYLAWTGEPEGCPVVKDDQADTSLRCSRDRAVHPACRTGPAQDAVQRAECQGSLVTYPSGEFSPTCSRIVGASPAGRISQRVTATQDGVLELEVGPLRATGTVTYQIAIDTTRHVRVDPNVIQPLALQVPACLAPLP